MYIQESKSLCVSLNLSASIQSYPDSKGKKRNLLFLFLKIVTCIDANVMLGFQMRYYKGHMLLSANFISLYILY